MGVKVETAERLIDYAGRGFCSGCGVCAGVCPAGTLEIFFDSIGQYVPKSTIIGCTSCGACLKVCPFFDENADEEQHGRSLFDSVEGMHYDELTGYYHDSFVGYAPENAVRLAGSSGGMLTWTLCDLIRRGEIDHAVCVRANPDPGKLYDFVVVSTPDELLGCGKSSYYPVEMSGMVQYMLEHDGRYAVVGLPCVCKAIRNAQRSFPELRNRIRYVFGLVCVGQQVNTRFAATVAEMAGLEGPMSQIRFRAKREGFAPANYLYVVKSTADAEKEISFFDGVNDLWTSGAFRLQGCEYCDDGFSECADAAFMDASLSPYNGDWKGTSIVLSRDPALSERFSKIETMERIPHASVVRSQYIGAKRDSLRARLFLKKLCRTPVPKKRVSPAVPSLKVLLKTLVQDTLVRNSRKNLAEGKPYNLIRRESLLIIFIQRTGSWSCKMVRSIRSRGR